jgi:hypothetical protein
MKRIVRLAVFFSLLGIIAVAGGCATQPMADSSDPPGFFAGLFHGLTIVFSIVGSLFTDYRIYAFPNSGWWYDFGFVIGASAVVGGTAASASTARQQTQPIP